MLIIVEHTEMVLHLLSADVPKVSVLINLTCQPIFQTFVSIV